MGKSDDVLCYGKTTIISLYSSMQPKLKPALKENIQRWNLNLFLPSLSVHWYVLTTKEEESGHSFKVKKKKKSNTNQQLDE